MASIEKQEAVTEVVVVQEEQYVLTLSKDEASMLRTLVGQCSVGCKEVTSVFNALADSVKRRTPYDVSCEGKVYPLIEVKKRDI